MSDPTSPDGLRRTGMPEGLNEQEQEDWKFAAAPEQPLALAHWSFSRAWGKSKLNEIADLRDEQERLLDVMEQWVQSPTSKAARGVCVSALRFHGREVADGNE